MDKHDEVCVCFHVSLQKIAKHCRLNSPKVPSQLSECYGAGTGCGWCIPFLEKIFEDCQAGEEPNLRMSREDYISRRKNYQSSGEPKKHFSR